MTPPCLSPGGPRAAWISDTTPRPRVPGGAWGLGEPARSSAVRGLTGSCVGPHPLTPSPSLPALPAPRTNSHPSRDRPRGSSPSRPSWGTGNSCAPSAEHGPAGLGGLGLLATGEGRIGPSLGPWPLLPGAKPSVGREKCSLARNRPQNTPIALGFCLFFNKQNFLLVWMSKRESQKERHRHF